jgi:hypothetical protein
MIGAYLGAPEESAVPRAYQTKFYITSGGDKAVVGDGGELEILSGGILDLQSGASITGTFDLNGGTLTIDADADTTLVASDDDVISTTIGAATGKLKVLTGNLAVGNGSPDTTLNGEDTYIEGTLEVDGALNFDGAMDLAGNATLGGYVAATGQITVADYVMIDGDADEIQLRVQSYTTQSNHLMVLEQSDGTDKFVVDNSGNLTTTKITLTNGEVIDNATDGLVKIGAQLGYQQYISDTTVSHTLTPAQTGAIMANDGAADNITHTLPTVAVGLCFGFLAQDNYLIYVDPNASEQIFYSGSAAGDYMVGSAQYDYLEICATEDGWFPVSVIGTWADE